MLCGRKIAESEAKVLAPRLLAHLGDAVFHLYEREREILSTVSAKDMHAKVVARVKADKQAELLEALLPSLSESESDIVRRARNLKPAGYRKAGQNVYRKATAFEALIGFLYLSDRERLFEILEKTLKEGAGPAPARNP